MAKDPAFLFYSQDFFTGTSTMNFEDKGKYIHILCIMHQQGRLSEETIRLLVGSISVSLKSKFSVDEKGLWFNIRLEEEIEKRQFFTNSRKSNGLKGGRPKNKKPNGKPTGNLMEDVNENDNEDVLENEIEKFLVPEMLKIFKHHNQTYKQNKERDYKPLLSIAKFLAGQGELTGSVQENRESILQAWGPLCMIISKDKFYNTKPLSTISKQIQEITQIALHGKSNGKPDYGSQERAKEFDRLFAERYGKGGSATGQDNA